MLAVRPISIRREAVLIPLSIKTVIVATLLIAVIVKMRAVMIVVAAAWTIVKVSGSTKW